MKTVLGFIVISVFVIHACHKENATSQNPTISGKIDITPELKNDVKESDTIFIIARHGASGPPLAVKKLSPQTFPTTYLLSQSDVMFAGSDFSGEVDVTVRVDKDGDAMTKNPGDLFGKTLHPIKVGSSNADVVINQKIP